MRRGVGFDPRLLFICCLVCSKIEDGEAGIPDARPPTKGRPLSIEDRIRDIVVPIVEDLGLVLFDLDYNGGKVKVTIDQDDGVDSQLLVLATQQISREFDEVDPIQTAYTIEVTTPGIERKLRRPQHFQRSLNYQVAVKLHEELDGDRRLTGTITAADDDGFTVRRGDGTDVVIDYDQVQKARTVFEWGPAPKPGGPKKKNPTNKAGV